MHSNMPYSSAHNEESKYETYMTPGIDLPNEKQILTIA